jgi:hypothetical protein
MEHRCNHDDVVVTRDGCNVITAEAPKTVAVKTDAEDVKSDWSTMRSSWGGLVGTALALAVQTATGRFYWSSASRASVKTTPHFALSFGSRFILERIGVEQVVQPQPSRQSIPQSAVPGAVLAKICRTACALSWLPHAALVTRFGKGLQQVSNVTHSRTLAPPPLKPA